MSLPPDQTATPQEVMYEEALSAIRSGERARARDLLTRLLKQGQENADYWVWMSAVVDTPKERFFCLKEALRVDPDNTAARRGLVIAGALPPQQDQVLPARLQKRDWQAALAQPEIAARASSPVYTIPLMAAALLVIVGLVGFALFGEQLPFRKKRRLVIPLPTLTEVAAAAVTASVTPQVTLSGSPIPLWMQLEATYTPTPVYVNTPHMDSEAFSLGMRALQRGEWAKADTFFRQAATQIAVSDPDSPDILYYLGENYRLQGKLDDGLEMFATAIDRAPDFAPAYLGRARVSLAQGSNSSAEAARADIRAAIENDPRYGEAYLTLAGLQIAGGQAQEALRTLDQAQSVLPGSPLVSIYRAQAYLALGDSQKALENARSASEMDVTLLLAYRVLGEALQAQGDLQGSISPLSTYLQYVQDDEQAWLSAARAYLAGGDAEEALSALDRALRLNNRRSEAYLLRAQIHLDLDHSEQALEDYQAAARIDPESFEAGIGIGKALMALDYPGDAWDRFERTRVLAKTELQKSELVYWRGQSLEALGELEAAIRDYRTLVGLPAGQVEDKWVQDAEERLLELVTKTPTPTPKPPTVTPTRTFTRQPTRTATPTRTSPPTRTVTPTQKP